MREFQVEPFQKAKNPFMPKNPFRNVFELDRNFYELDRRESSEWNLFRKLKQIQRTMRSSGNVEEPIRSIWKKKKIMKKGKIGIINYNKICKCFL